MIPLFADVTFSTEAMVAVGALLLSLAGAVGYIFKLLIKAKDDQIALALEKSQAKSFREMLDEALSIVETRVAKSVPGAAKTLAPVVGEHDSPMTPEAKAIAEVSTSRARLTAVTLALGLPARESGPPVDSQKTPAGVVTELLRQDVAAVSEKVEAVPAKVAEKIKEQEQSPPGGPS